MIKKIKILCYVLPVILILPTISLAQSNDCPTTYEPVCGDNGKTYSNPCHILVRNSLYNNRYPETSINHHGVCEGYVPPSTQNDPITIPAIDTSIIEKQTESKCPLLYQPLCGIDGRTYPNQCVADKKKMPIAHTDECNDESPIMGTCTEFFNGCTLCKVKDGKITTCEPKACSTTTMARCTKHTYDLDAHTTLRVKEAYTKFYTSFRRKHGWKSAFLLKELRDTLNQKIQLLNEGIELNSISIKRFHTVKFTINIYNLFIQHIDQTITTQEGYYYLPEEETNESN